MADSGRVVATDDQAALSKASCVRRNYWKDDALLALIHKGPRRSPIIHAGYYVRYNLISAIIRKVLKNNFEQVLVLGAGSDTSFWRLNIAKNYPSIKWFEIDFPKNLEFKSTCMESIYGKSDNYFPVPADLRHLEQVHTSLVKAGLNVDAKTFVISEVVLAYLTAAHSTGVINWIAKTFTCSLFVEFEQFNASSTFGTVMTKHFTKIGSPILTIEKLSTIKSRFERLRLAHFDSFDCFPLSSIAPAVLQIEPFDEFETLNYFLKHYYIGIGSRNLDGHLFYPTRSVPSQYNIEEERKIWMVRVVNNRSHRSFYGFVKYENVFYFAGGLGSSDSNQNHRKLDSISLIDQDGNEEVLATIGALQSPHCIVLEGHLLVFGGRLSPNKPSGRLLVFQILCDGRKLNKIIDTTNPVFSTYRSSIVMLDDSTIVRVGGRGSSGEFSNAVEIIKFNFNAKLPDDLFTVSSITSQLPDVASACVTIDEDKVLRLTGGVYKTGCISDEIIEFTIRDRSEVEILSRSKLPFGIYGHTFNVNANGEYIFIGGVTSMALENDCIIEYLPGSNRIVIGEMDSPTLLLVGHSVSVESECIKVFGGGANCFSFGTHFNPMVSLLTPKH